MSKKKNKSVAKRKAQAKSKQHRKTKIKHTIAEPKTIAPEQPPLSSIETPPGFRAVSMNQAIMEYAKPLLDESDIKDPNNAFQLAMLLWNFGIDLEQGDFKDDKPGIVTQIQQILKLDNMNATEFFDMMIERKQYLFPDELQRKDQMLMIMRQEEKYLISEFNYDSLVLSDEVYTPAEKDRQLIPLFDRMEQYLLEGTDYSDWEDFYFKMEEACKSRYGHWLKLKGLEKQSSDFPFYVETFLNFTYRYMHREILTLKNFKSFDFEEYFFDHIIRKVIAEPHELIKWPPAVKLFYRFLGEIGYIDKSEKYIKLIDKIEPEFLQIIKQMYK